jgi:hypothetical protein
MATHKERSTTPPRVVDTRTLDDDAHIRIDTVSRETGLQPGTIRNRISHLPPTFPPPVQKDGPGPNYWRLGDIREYLRNDRGRKK